MRKIFIIIFSFLIQQAFAQPSDFLILKKNNRTVRTYYAGGSIEMTTKQGVYRNAVINAIRHDSLFLQEFLVQHIPTAWGNIVHDTLGSFRYVYHYRDILKMEKQQRGFNFATSGKALVGGAVLIAFGSGVVYVSDKEKFSPELLIGGLTLGGVGYLLTKLSSRQIVIGRRGYKFQYVQVTTQ